MSQKNTTDKLNRAFTIGKTVSNPASQYFIANLCSYFDSKTGYKKIINTKDLYDNMFLYIKSKVWCNGLTPQLVAELVSVFNKTTLPKMMTNKSSFESKDFAEVILKLYKGHGQQAIESVTKGQRSLTTFTDIGTALMSYEMHNEIVFFTLKVTEGDVLQSPLKHGYLPSNIYLNNLEFFKITTGPKQKVTSFATCNSFIIKAPIISKKKNLKINTGKVFTECPPNYVEFVKQMNDIDRIATGQSPFFSTGTGTGTSSSKGKKGIKKGGNAIMKGGVKKIPKISSRKLLLPGYLGGTSKVRVFKAKCCDCWLCGQDLNIYLIFYEDSAGEWQTSYYQCGEVEHVYAPGIGNIVGTLFFTLQETNSIEATGEGVVRNGLLCSHAICNQTKNQLALADAKGNINDEAIKHFLYGKYSKDGVGNENAPGVGSLLYNILNNKFQMLSPDILFLHEFITTNGSPAFIAKAQGEMKRVLQKIKDNVCPSAQTDNLKGTLNQTNLLELRCIHYAAKVCNKLYCLDKNLQYPNGGGNLMKGGASPELIDAIDIIEQTNFLDDSDLSKDPVFNEDNGESCSIMTTISKNLFGQRNEINYGTAFAPVSVYRGITIDSKFINVDLPEFITSGGFKYYPGDNGDYYFDANGIQFFYDLDNNRYYVDDEKQEYYFHDDGRGFVYQDGVSYKNMNDYDDENGRYFFNADGSKHYYYDLTNDQGYYEYDDIPFYFNANGHKEIIDEDLFCLNYTDENGRPRQSEFFDIDKVHVDEDNNVIIGRNSVDLEVDENNDIDYSFIEIIGSSIPEEEKGFSDDYINSDTLPSPGSGFDIDDEFGSEINSVTYKRTSRRLEVNKQNLFNKKRSIKKSDNNDPDYSQALKNEKNKNDYTRKINKQKLLDNRRGIIKEVEIGGTKKKSNKIKGKTIKKYRMHFSSRRKKKCKNLSLKKRL